MATILTENNVRRPKFDFPGNDHFIQIKDGVYTVSFMDSKSRFVFASPRVVAAFRIDDDVGQERRILGYYKVNGLFKDGVALDTGDRVWRPEFSIGWRSRLARDLGTLFPNQYSPQNLPTFIRPIDHPVRVRTRTVVKDLGGDDRPESFRCSVVDRILGWAE